MAMSAEEFIKATGAEVVADNLIVGIMGARKKVGSIEEGVLNLTAEGKALMEELEASPKRGRKAEKAEAEEPKAA